MQPCPLLSKLVALVDNQHNDAYEVYKFTIIMLVMRSVVFFLTVCVTDNH